MRLDAAADAAAGQERIGGRAGAAAIPGVAAVVAYEPGGDARLVSRDGRSTYLLADFTQRTQRGAPTRSRRGSRASP